MFKKDPLRLDYLVLAVGLITGSAAYIIFQTQRPLEIITICSLGLFYFLWGIWHHWREKELHVKIILEYLLIAVLATVLLLSLILRV